MLRKLSRNNKRDFGKIISLLRILNGFHKDRKVSKISRKPSSEVMIRKSIYGPARLLNIPNFSERVVELLERNSTHKNVIDEHFATIQSKIAEYIKEDPTIPRLYSRDDMAAERVIKARLLIDQLEATASEISAAIVASGKVRG